MTPNERMLVVLRSRTPAQATARLRARMRRDERKEARREKLNIAQVRRKRFLESAEKSFEIMQSIVVPNVKLRVTE